MPALPLQRREGLSTYAVRSSGDNKDPGYEIIYAYQRRERTPPDPRLPRTGLTDGFTFRATLIGIHEILEVSFTQDRQVVGEMTRDDIGESADRYRVVAGDAAARPGIGREISEEGKGG